MILIGKQIGDSENPVERWEEFEELKDVIRNNGIFLPGDKGYMGREMDESKAIVALHDQGFVKQYIIIQNHADVLELKQAYDRGGAIKTPRFFLSPPEWNQMMIVPLTG